jgi:hypothetical protein
MAALEDVVSNMRNGVTSLSKIALALTNAFPTIVSGNITLSAATTTVVSQTGTVATSIVLLSATNTSAASTVLFNGVYISAIVAGTSFSVSTLNNPAGGNETFSYVVYP